MVRLSSRILSLAAAAALCVSTYAAQAAPNPPANGYPVNQDIGAVITNTLATPQTVTGTPRTNNGDWRGVVCAFLVSASSGSGTQTWSIEGYDAATASWYQIATTSAIAFNPYASATVSTLAAYPGVATSSLSSGNVAQSAVVPRVWRLKDVIANVSGSPAVTSKGGCNYIN